MIYAKPNIVSIETLWDVFQCGGDPIYDLLSRIVIAERSKSTPKVSFSRFEYHKKVQGFYTFENSDHGLTGYYETAALEVVSDSSCD